MTGFNIKCNTRPKQVNGLIVSGFIGGTFIIYLYDISYARI